MAWRQLNPEPEKEDPLAKLLKPVTFDEMMEELEYEDA